MPLDALPLIEGSPIAPPPRPTDLPLVEGMSLVSPQAAAPAPAPPASAPGDLPLVEGTSLVPAPATSPAPDQAPLSAAVAPGPEPKSGLFSGFASGVSEAGRLGGRTLQGQAFALDPNAPAPPAPDQSPGFFYEVGHGLGYSLPTLAAGFGGAAGGAAIGSAVPVVGTTLGGIVGGGLGVALASAAQDLAPTYEAAIQRGLTHDQAVDYAWTHGTATGAISGLTAAVPGGRTVLGKILFQSLVGQPIGGAAVRAGVPAVMGEPLPTMGEMARGYGQDVVGGFGVSAGHAAGSHLVQAVRGEQPPPPPTASSDVDIEARQAFSPGGIATEQVVTPPPRAELSSIFEPPVSREALPEIQGTPISEPPPQVVPPDQTRDPVATPTTPLPPTAEPVTAPPDDRPNPAAGRSDPAGPLGEGDTSRQDPLPGGPGRGGDTGERPPDTPGAQGELRPGGPAEPGAVVAGETTPPVPQGETTPEPAPRVTTEPDHLDPNRHVAKNEAGEVIGKGATPEEASADAQRRGGEIYPAEEQAKAPAPAETAPAEAPAAAPPAAEPAKRPVTTEERRTLQKSADNAYKAFRNAESRKGAQDPATLAAQEKYRQAHAALEATEGPPTKVTRAFGGSYDPSLTREQRNKLIEERHNAENAAVDAHQARVDERVHAEGTAPTPEPNKAGQIFAGRDAGVLRGPDSEGTIWTGDGTVLVKGDTLTRPYNQASGRKTTTVRTPPDPAAMSRVTTPNPKVNYQKITWDRAVTDPHTGEPLVLGTKPDGTRVALKKPIYDTMHAAAGADGTIVGDARSVKGGSDDRLFARNAKGETVAVGMPIRVDQARAEVWAKGREPAARPTEQENLSGRTELAEPLADRPLVPGPEEAPRTSSPDLTEPRTGPDVTPEVTPEPARPAPRVQPLAEPLPPRQEGSPRLTRLTATRDALAEKTQRTQKETLKLSDVTDQVARLRKAEGLAPEPTSIPTPEALAARRGGRKQPFSGPPVPTTVRDATDYHFNDGTSVYRSVFAEAGHDPNVAVNQPMNWQVRVLTQHMVSKFGFASVEVVGRRGPDASQVDQKIARDAMLDMTRAMVDGMASLALPHSAASLNGRLKLVIEPEGSRRYYGQYDLREGEIRVTGGANSFGHEWAHAVDHYLAERLTGNPGLMNNLLSQHARRGDLNIKDPVQAAFAKVITTMFYDDAALAGRRLGLEMTANKVDKAGNPTKAAIDAQRQLDLLDRAGSQLRIQPSRFRGEAQRLDAGHSKPYYQQVYEMLARAHEGYMARLMDQAGVDPRGIVMPDEAYIQETRQMFELAYPKGADRMKIFAAFDDLHDAMRNEQVLSNGQPPGNFSNYGVSDPHHWRITAPQAGGTAIGRVLRNEIARLSKFSENLTNEALYDRNRPSSRLGFGAKFADGFRAITFSAHGRMETIIARAPDAAKRPLTKIMDLVAGAPGEGRYTGEHFEKAVRVKARGWMNQFANIMDNNSIKPYARTQAATLDNAMLRHAMVTGETVYEGQQIPGNLIKAAGDMRLLMDQMWRASHDAGMDVGYASRYYPRLYDLATVFNDPGGFKTAAHRLHSFMFDQEVGPPGADPQGLLERWTTLSKTDRNMAAHPNLAGWMGELNKNLARQREIEANPAPTPAEIAELAKLKSDANQLAIDAHDPLRDHIADLATTAWHTRLVLGNHADYDTTGPSSSYLQSRELPPEADIIMRDYMHTEMTDAIPNYIHAVARRIAYTERFGQHGEGLDQAFKALVNIPGMRPEDLRTFRDLINVTTGRPNDRTPLTQDLQRISNVIHAVGSLALMPRAVWSSLAEPMASALVTGDMRVGFRVFSHQFGQMMRTASAAERTEFAQFHNVVTSAMYDSIMLSRMTADYADSPRLNRLMTNYYRVTGLTQLTNSQRAGAAAASHWFLTKLARDFQDPGTSTRKTNARDNATRWFNELGAPPGEHDGFAQWLVDQNGKLPDLRQLQTDPMKAIYGNTIYNLTDRIIQDPYKVDRATLSTTPGLGLAFQLMSFNYQFQRNVLNPLWTGIEHSFGRAKLASQASGAGPLASTARGTAAAGGTVAHSAAMAGTVLGVGLVTTALRQYLFAPDQWERHEADGTLADYLTNLTFQRSGLNGTLDPIIQVFTNLRYNADLTSLMDGASVHWFSQNAQDVIQPFITTNDSPNTNTRLFNQARGAFNLIGVPAAAYGLTMLGAAGGPVTRAIAGGALMYGTSPGAANEVAELAVGSPKGAERRPEPKPGELPKLPKMESGLPKLPKIPKPGETSSAEAGGSAPSAGWGLIDDIAAPAWRYGSGLLGSVPRAIKYGAVGAAALYGGSKYLDMTEPFRGQPAPPPKP